MILSNDEVLKLEGSKPHLLAEFGAISLALIQSDACTMNELLTTLALVSTCSYQEVEDGTETIKEVEE